ncbi:MAG TPA: prepilin-type N-terminal cleavage/methylation domain-containing protein [Solirubrobacteraceae bacterium]|nr:prepilin-type N-terminal cleavage/methylation domain-containing protein [Solirubrobacteraceae bacterium]
MEHRPRHARQGGFTIIEVMVAAFVLLVGVLGTITLIDTAIDVGSTSRSREAATNLTREIVETSRLVDYDVLLTATAPAALQAEDGLADDASTPGWQIERRGVTYTVTVQACIYDDAKDGNFAGNAGAEYCSGLGTGNTDANGDDYRKLTVVAAWEDREVRLVANVVNPAGGFGPRITSVASSPAVNTNGDIPVSGTTGSVAMTIGTSAATALNWDAGNATDGGQLTNAAGATSWSFNWGLGTPVPVGSYTCDTNISWVPDAPAYQMTFQPFDSSGTPGDLRTQTIAVDRSTPYPLCDFTGGRNAQHGGIVDLQWRASFEGDVFSYSVWRKRQGAEPSDRLVCDSVRDTGCTDTQLPNNVDAIQYVVRPKQENFALGTILGPSTSFIVPSVGSGNRAPTAPSGVAVSTGTPQTISWNASSDSDGTVIFYRVYRDGQAIANRYGKTSNAETLSFTDRDGGGTSHTYYVSAVDDGFAESAVVGP